MNQNKIVSFCFEYKAEILVSIIFAFCAFAFNTYRVEGDGLLYYGVLEKTLHIADPESSIDNLRSGFMQCGNVFFNIPFYLMGYLAEKAFHLKVNIDGVTLRTASINIASNFYLLLSLILCVRILKKLNLKNIILPCLCVLFSTSAYTVSTIMPSWNHSVDIFINTLFIYLFLMIELSAQKKYAIALGVVFISSILVRYFNFILIIPVIFYLIYKRDINNLKAVLITSFLFGLIIPLVFYLYNGSPFSFFASASIQDIASKSVLYYPAYSLKYLVHPIHGLFIWAPVTILSFIGLYFPAKNIKNINLVFLITVLLLVLINGFSPLWHAGWSFTNRYMVGLFAIYVIGLSSFLELKNKYYVILPIIFTSYSVVLFFNWLLTTADGQYGSVIDIFYSWKNGYSPNFGPVKIGVFMKRLFLACRYKYVVNFFIK